MFDEAYVEPERTEVLVAPVNPAQPVELHYMHAGDAGADLVTTAHVELGPSSVHWSQPVYASPCPPAMSAWCTRDRDWP